MNMLQILLITSFEIIGICMLFKEDMIFERPGEWLELHLPYYISKPLFMCIPCMASAWGTLLWFVQWNGTLSFGLLFFVLGVAGINYLFSKTFLD